MFNHIWPAVVVILVGLLFGLVYILKLFDRGHRIASARRGLAQEESTSFQFRNQPYNCQTGQERYDEIKGFDDRWREIEKLPYELKVSPTTGYVGITLFILGFIWLLLAL